VLINKTPPERGGSSNQIEILRVRINRAQQENPGDRILIDLEYLLLIITSHMEEPQADVRGTNSYDQAWAPHGTTELNAEQTPPPEITERKAGEDASVEVFPDAPHQSDEAHQAHLHLPKDRTMTLEKDTEMTSLGDTPEEVAITTEIPKDLDITAPQRKGSSLSNSKDTAQMQDSKGISVMLATQV
jgi:hypothetical protein